jgi:hypothetical protein
VADSDPFEYDLVPLNLSTSMSSPVLPCIMGCCWSHCLHSVPS